MEVSLLGLGIGIILASFQFFGIMFELSAKLYMAVRYPIASEPKCLRCLMFMLSGPDELLFLDALIAAIVCSVVIVKCVVGSLWVYRSIVLLFACVVCLTTFVYCLLNSMAFCLFVLAILLWKVMVVLGVGVSFLLFSAASVFQSLCELFL